jgi:hypothetical protein
MPSDCGSGDDAGVGVAAELDIAGGDQDQVGQVGRRLRPGASPRLTKKIGRKRFPDQQRQRSSRECDQPPGVRRLKKATVSLLALSRWQFAISG